MTPSVRQCVAVRCQCVNALSNPVRQCVSAYIDNALAPHALHAITTVQCVVGSALVSGREKPVR